MDQVSIKYTNIFQCKTLQNLPKFRSLVSIETIWQTIHRYIEVRIKLRTVILRLYVLQENVCIKCDDCGTTAFPRTTFPRNLPKCPFPKQFSPKRRLSP
jgi:hypothetical protein